MVALFISIFIISLFSICALIFLLYWVKKLIKTPIKNEKNIIKRKIFSSFENFARQTPPF
jgi:hypothetical protein